jgi:hypothetical protein
MGSSLASAAGITFTCDSSIDSTVAGTCAYLNSSVAALYSSTFTNANASIYITYDPNAGLGQSTPGFFNEVAYGTYLTALTATASSDAVDLGALAAMNALDTAAYGTGNAEITSALAGALGITQTVGNGANSVAGTTSGGAICYTPGVGTCYNGIIDITTQAHLTSEEPGQTLYYDQNGGTQDANAYDFYSVVEHELDEVLGTSSCVDTNGSLTNDCPDSGTPSAVDLFRYQSAGNLVLLSTTPGAYFSYDGGVTNGSPTGSVYNTVANGNDYADFTANCVNVQDGTACLGSRLDITGDGGSEINILDAVGYNQVNSNTPEPGTMALFGIGLVALGLYRRRRA